MSGMSLEEKIQAYEQARYENSASPETERFEREFLNELRPLLVKWGCLGEWSTWPDTNKISEIELDDYSIGIFSYDSFHDEKCGRHFWRTDLKSAEAFERWAGLEYEMQLHREKEKKEKENHEFELRERETLQRLLKKYPDEKCKDCEQLDVILSLCKNPQLELLLKMKKHIQKYGKKEE